MTPRGWALAFAFLLLAGCTGTERPDAPDTDGDGIPDASDPDPIGVASSLPSKLDAPQVVSDVLVATPGFAEPNIAVAPDGTLYIANPGNVWRSDDGGKSWKDLGAVDGGGDGDLAIDGRGTLYYLGLFGQSGAIPFQTSGDHGESWSEPVDVSDDSGSDREWIDVTADGRVYGTWRGAEGMEFRASLDRGNTWNAKTVAGADGDGGPVVMDPLHNVLYVPVIDLGPLVGATEPTVHVYTSTNDGDDWTAHDLGTLPRSTPVEPNGYNSDFPVIAVDSAGTAYLVYSADASGIEGFAPPEEAALFGIYLRVSKDQGATWSEPQLLSTPGKSARFPWVAAGAPGRVAVVWYENRNGIPSETLPDLWDVRLLESISADTSELAPVLVNLNGDASHLGSLCTSGTGCVAADRSLLDFFEVAIAPNGQPVVAWASSDVGTGLGPAVRATEIHFSTVKGTPLR